MGGFVYCRRTDARETSETSDVHPAVTQMALRGMQPKAVLRRPGFELHVYRKRRFDTENVVELDGGDFVVATGTLIYDGQSGEPALRRLFDDFRAGRLTFENLHGQFAAWVYTNGELWLWNDYQGLNQIYHAPDFGCISSSFLAAYAACSDFEPCPQEVFEYLAFSMYYGTRSVLRGIERLGRTQLVRVFPDVSARPKSMRLSAPAETNDFQFLLDRNHELLRQVFASYVAAFGDRISIGLTGGYDSRLILAYLRHCGSSPHVYVQGPDASVDVRVAKQVAAAVGFEIRHDAGEARPDFRPEAFEKVLLESFRYIDGFNPAGLFQDWSLVAPDRGRVDRPERLRLYGMAGEMYRRSLALPNRRVSFDEFFTVQADKLDTSSFSTQFDKRAFYRSVGDKMMAAMGLPDRSLSPVDAELTYPHFRLAFNSGWQMSAQNERAHALVPFGEPLLSHGSAGIEMRHRRHGRFEAALIERADPALASVPTAYGYTPARGPGLRAQLRELANEAVPTSLRPHLHRYRTRRKLEHGSLPFYLQPDYLAEIFPEGTPHIAPFIDLGRERNPAVISRALTLEILLAGRFR